jgi:hypothetical protein
VRVALDVAHGGLHDRRRGSSSPLTQIRRTGGTAVTARQWPWPCSFCESRHFSARFRILGNRPERQPILPIDLDRYRSSANDPYSLGQHVERRCSYRQMYRHFGVGSPRAASPSIDIYREPSARPRWPAFEIYRGQSRLRKRFVWREGSPRSARSDHRDVGTKGLKLLSHRVFRATFLPSRRSGSEAKVSAHPPSAPRLPSTV